MGLFITIEGIEGAGKTTLIDKLKTHKQLSDNTYFTREPGGTDIGEQIRRLMVDSANENMEPLTELLLAYASRNEHVKKVIEPLLAEGKTVISDRFYDASYAYQGGGRHLAHRMLSALDDWVLKDLVPSLTILIKAPVEICLERVRSRGNQDRFDDESCAFFHATQAAYVKRAEADPGRFLIVDGTRHADEIFDSCITKILSLR